MAIVHQIDTYDPEAHVKTAFLNSALSILITTVVKERRDFDTRTVSAGIERQYNWWTMEADRLARPNPVPLLYANTKQYVDYETFEIDVDEGGHYLFYDYIFAGEDIEIPVFDSDSTESVLVDMLATGLYSIALHEEFHVGYAYLAFMYGISSLIKINETIKPQFKQPTVITIKATEL